MKCKICKKDIFSIVPHEFVVDEKTEGKVVHKICYDSKFNTKKLKIIHEESWAENLIIA